MKEQKQEKRGARVEKDEKRECHFHYCRKWLEAELIVGVDSAGVVLPVAASHCVPLLVLVVAVGLVVVVAAAVVSVTRLAAAALE